MALLPDAEKADIPRDKLADYVLNPEHETGRHKARVFRSALGFTAENWEDLRDQIATGVLSADISSVRVGLYGTRYSVPVMIEGTNGKSHEVITAWIVEEEGQRPRLTSAYVSLP